MEERNSLKTFLSKMGELLCEMEKERPGCIDHLTPSRVEAIRALVHMEEMGFEVFPYSFTLKKQAISAGSLLPPVRVETSEDMSSQARSRTTGSGDERSLKAPSISAMSESSAATGIPKRLAWLSP